MMRRGALFFFPLIAASALAQTVPVPTPRGPSDRDLTRWVEELGADDPAVRAEATEGLVDHYEAAQSFLGAADLKDAEVRARLAWIRRAGLNPRAGRLERRLSQPALFGNPDIAFKCWSSTPTEMLKGLGLVEGYSDRVDPDDLILLRSALASNLAEHLDWDWSKWGGYKNYALNVVAMTREKRLLDKVAPLLDLPETAEFAITAYARIAPEKEARARIGAMLADDSPARRTSAINALTELKAVEHRSLIKDIALYKDDSLRSAALHYFSRLLPGQPDAVEVALTVLDGTGFPRAIDGARALDQWGKAAEHRAELKASLDHFEDPSLRQVVLDILRKIDGK